MHSPGPEPEDAVPLADAEIAARIARAARRGRGTDRTPTLEQLLSAFGEDQPTPRARRRALAALRLADVDVRPALSDVEPGERLLLTAPGGPGRRAGGRALGGLLALAVILAAAAIAATLAGQGGGDRASDDLPPDRTAGSAAATATTATTAAAARTSGADTAVATTRTATTGATATTTTGAAAPGRKRRRAAPAVVVKVSALTRPTFLCVEDGSGRQLYGGTLSGTQTFRGKVVRLNVGLASTQVTVNGRPVALSGSPAGLEVSRKGGAKPLPLGQRPCA